VIKGGPIHEGKKNWTTVQKNKVKKGGEWRSREKKGGNNKHTREAKSFREIARAGNRAKRRAKRRQAEMRGKQSEVQGAKTARTKAGKGMTAAKGRKKKGAEVNPRSKKIQVKFQGPDGGKGQPAPWIKKGSVTKEKEKEPHPRP